MDMSTPVVTGPTTLDLMRMYAVMEQRKTTLKTEIEQLDAFQKTIEDQLGARLQSDDDAHFAHTFDDGLTVTVKRKKSERWIPIDGQSDEFWNWVHSNNLGAQFCTRTLKQDGVDQWREAHRTSVMPDGELPPFVKKMTTTTPTVGVKGLVTPKAPKA